jgi:chromosome segregation ATPase
LKESSEQSANEEVRHQEKKQQTQEEKLSLKSKLNTDESSYEEEIRALKEIERKEMTKLREEYEQAHAALLRQSEQRLSELKDDLELRRKMEIHEIEERKNRHINDLMDNHERAFAEMKNYYNSITRDNLTLIKSLKDELQELHSKHTENQTIMGDLSQRNERLNDPLRSAQQHVHELRVKLKNYTKDRESLRQARARLAVLEEEYVNEQTQHRTLVDQYSGLERERTRLYENFEHTVMSVHQRSNRKNMVLEKVLEEYKDVFETKKAQFGAVLRASNLDPVVLTDVTKKLDDVLSSKTEMINDLKYERAKISKSHNDLVRVYESKLTSFGIPRDELRLRDMITGPSARGTGTAPADLIVV